MISLASEGVRQIDPTPSSSEFYSPRIESMIASKSEFDTELEFRTAHSKVHWSELSTEDVNEESVKDHRQEFVELQNDALWGPFCSEVVDVVLGAKLGEGAQAVIYEAKVTFAEESRLNRNPLYRSLAFVVKLMKGDCALADFKRQWPQGLANLGLDCLCLFGALVKDPATERIQFGFVMHRGWGDLRTLIDIRMQHKKARDPPFSVPQAKELMTWIMRWMFILHMKGIIHRDLKAANVLLGLVDDKDPLSSSCLFSLQYVADFECSVGVVGTGFWRAPEILQQLKNRVPGSKVEFTKKADVYSFGMTCYEIVTGRIPFEDLPNNYETRDAILNGARPELPHNLDPKTREMITLCWNPNPSLRPRFSDLSHYEVYLERV